MVRKAKTGVDTMLDLSKSTLADPMDVPKPREKKIKRKPRLAAIREKTKALRAKNLALRGKPKVQKRKVYHKVTFRRPHTLIKARTPKYLKHSLVKADKNHYCNIIQYPVTSECAMKKVEESSTLTFVVNPRANKHSIKTAVQALHEVDIAKINVLNNHDGKRIAFVKLSPECDTVGIANKIGII